MLLDTRTKLRESIRDPSRVESTPCARLVLASTPPPFPPPPPSPHADPPNILTHNTVQRFGP